MRDLSGDGNGEILFVEGVPLFIDLFINYFIYFIYFMDCDWFLLVFIVVG